MMSFELHPNLASKIWIIDLPLCSVLLEDERNYPWLFLVPRRTQVSRIIQLNLSDQWQLMQELNCAQQILWNHFSPDQINVAAIGNRTPQLHLHVIARRYDDPAWPAVVWDHCVKACYLLEEKKQRIQLLKEAFEPFLTSCSA